MSKPRIITIVGPTSSGKSSLGVYLATKLGGEVISADSRQVYRRLNLGTGKITAREMQGIPHHLLDVSNPSKQFSVSDFVKRAEQTIIAINKGEKVPIIVGGTGLYTDVLLGRMAIPEVPPNEALRIQLEKKTVTQLFTILKKLDARRAKTIEPKHKRRLIRAIEIAKALGKAPLPHPTAKYEVLWLGLNPSAPKLKRNIHTRLLARIRAGMIAEARALHEKGLSYKRMDELGLEYRSLALLLRNQINKKEFTLQLERAINKYSKRQMRWFKRNQDIRWVKNKTEALALSKKFLGGR